MAAAVAAVTSPRIELLDFVSRPIRHPGYPAGENATGIAAMIGAMERLHARKPDVFRIAPGDAQSPPLMIHRDANGHDARDSG